MTTLAARGSGTPATTGTTWATVTNAVDGAAGTNPATYTTYTNAAASAVATIEITGYGFSSSIAATDTLNSVTVSLRHFENNTGRFASVRFQAFDGATAIGSQTTCTLATAARNDTATPAVTLAQLRSSTFKVVVTITGAASTQSRVESIDYCDVTADYTIAPPAITQAAYRFYADGTETGATALAAQDTGYTADTSTGDVNLQLRARLQSTTAIAVPTTDDFQLQWEKNTSGTWANVTSGDASTYDETNQTASAVIGEGRTTWYIAQSFLGDGGKLSRVSWYVNRMGSPTGNTSAVLYAHSGTFGSSSIPTGTALATSTPVDIATISTTLGWVDYDFDGTFTLTNGTAYVIALITPVTTAGNDIWYGYDSTSSTHPGNGSFYNGTVWASSTLNDRIHKVRTLASTVIPYASANLTDGAATTNRLGAGSGSFVAGKISETGLVTDLGWTANNYTEVLYSVTLKQADLAPTDTVRFRVLRNAATTNMTYTATPTVTIGAGGPVDRTGTATGSLSLAGTATGTKDVTGTATGSLSLTGAAAGVGATPGNDVTGTSTGALTLAGTVTGVRGTPATATGTLTVTATATGQKTVGATATGSLAVAGTASGIKTVAATATGAVALAGTAVGAKTVTATAAGTLTITGTATGTATAAPILGQATSSLTITATATGTHGVAGTATGSLSLAGTSIGVRGRPGVATGTLTLSGTSTGTKQVTATATGQITFTSSALGLVEGNAVGTATGQVTLGGTATGTRGTPATATGSVQLQGLASGTRGTPATATGTLSLQGLATGVTGVTGQAVGQLTLTGTATSIAVSTVVGQWNDADVVAYQYGPDPVVEWFMLISVERKATATGGLTLGGAAAGITGNISGRPTGTLTIIGVATGIGTTPPSGVDVLFEDFANFTDAPWTLVSTTPTIVAGRTGTAAQTVGLGRADYTIPAINESDTVTIGFAYRATAITAASRMIVQLCSDTNTIQHNQLRHDGATGQLIVFRGGANVIGSSAAGLIVVNTWYYLELQAKLHDTTGAVTVRLNGNPVITVGPVDTRNAGTKTVYDSVRLGAPSLSNTNQYDDLYITVGAGAPFKGDITV